MIYEPLAQVNAVRPADDVAFSFSIRKDNPALNADALPYGEITTADNTVTVTFTASQFVNQAKVLNLFVVPKHIWSAIADPTTDLNQEPVGTGPYTLETWTPQAATLTTALVNGDAQWGWTFIPVIRTRAASCARSPPPAARPRSHAAPSTTPSSGPPRSARASPADGWRACCTTTSRCSRSSSPCERRSTLTRTGVDPAITGEPSGRTGPATGPQ